MIIAQSEWTPASTETCWQLNRAVRTEECKVRIKSPSQAPVSTPVLVVWDAMAVCRISTIRDNILTTLRKTFPTNSSSVAVPFLCPSSESRLLKAQCTL